MKTTEKHPDFACVYGIFTPLGVYVGSTKNLRRRVSAHLHRLRRGTCTNKRLQAAWTTDADKFEFRPILRCAPEDLRMYEERIIDALLPEFNVCRMRKGEWHSEEGRAALVEKLTGRRASDAARAKMRERGLTRERKHLAFGRLWALAELEAAYGINARTIKYRLKHGLSVEEAVTRKPHFGARL